MTGEGKGDLTSADPARAGVLTFGEIHTGLLQNSTALPSDRVQELLDLVVGERVRRSERPIAYAASPDRLTGVDCSLPSATNRDTRAIGTVIGHVTVTGGHIVQGSARTTVVPVHRHGLRLPWSHYLARPGTLEPIGKFAAADVAEGFLAGNRRAVTLDVGAISGRAVDEIQASSLLDRKRPLRTSRTTLRWAVLPATKGNRASFSIDSKTTRTLLIHADDGQHPAELRALCEDLALHDWLLTTILTVLDNSLDTAGGRTQRVRKLHPAVDWLLHLWMPAAHLDPAMLPLWKLLDERAGFNKQWRTSVDRIRDQLNLNTMTLLEEAAENAAAAAPLPFAAP
ncbi:SCO2521 family protein [Actinoplanes sp. URMC 104]|uniref:SCO2521 family protein n=1 Tax=Actinoplanes sp. URMC 104 TaxID=3423409 RepID=UPI003F1CCECA